MTVTKIISGGQTGADQAALIAARAMGIATGGTAPKGWRTEDGPAPWLADYGLVEHFSTGYSPRTLKNILDSDGTVIFGDPKSAGSRLTIELCCEVGRPYAVNPHVGYLSAWCAMHRIATLNVAGNRASKAPFITQAVTQSLVAAFGRRSQGSGGDDQY